MGSSSYWLVETALKRIQTYLFEVPRLSVMVGANAIVGETVRGLWQHVAGQDPSFDRSVPSLPSLAQEYEASLPADVDVTLTGAPRCSDVLYDADADIWHDDPKQVAYSSGILARDGGHFDVVFPCEANAKRFIAAARRLVYLRLPGAVLDVRLAKLVRDEGGYRRVEKPVDTLTTKAMLSLPQSLVCEYSGADLASVRPPETGEGITGTAISDSVDLRRKYGKRFDAGETHDILGLLRKPLLEAVDGDTEGDCLPTQFEELSTQGYMAVLHVDGNSVGRRSREHMKALERKDEARETELAPDRCRDVFAQWAHRESFFHAMRCGFRTAVMEAVGATFRGLGNGCEKTPLRLLMLGGDDLLLVCGAPYAIQFVIEFSKGLRKTTKDLPGEDGSAAPLSVGAGLVIVQDTFPFHRAHELAEDLASSAKRFKSSPRAGDGNVIDWLVTTEGWHGDIGETRRRHALIDGELVLSAKPYRILKGVESGEEADRGDKTTRSLEALWEDACALVSGPASGRPARSQLLGLCDRLGEGRHTARFAADSLPAEIRKTLLSRNYLSLSDGPWRRAGAKWITELNDLVELCELERLRQAEERAVAVHGGEGQPKDPQESEP